MRALSVLLLLAISQVTISCTTFGLGRKATVDGSVITSHSNDGSGTTDPRLVEIPAQDYEPGSMRPVYYSPKLYPRYVGYDRKAPEYYKENCQAGPGNCENLVPLGYIPQVNHTFAYFEAGYGVMNEKQVSSSESTCSGVFAALPIGSGGNALFSVNQLSQVALERASTAREAIKIMGELSERYGYYGASASFEGGAESLIIADTNEVWVFHILADPTGSSSIWAAARVPDDSVAVVANMFSIREMDLSDPDNFMGRLDMWDLAEQQGLYVAGDPKDFTATFSDGEYAHKYYSGRRMWGVFHRLSPSAELPADYGNLKRDAPYPFAVKVDNPASVQDVMAVMRDWYNGTRFSTGEGSGVAGGAFSTPDRYGGNSKDGAVQGNWERTIAIYRSSDTYVVQSRSWLPDAVGGVVWFGPGAAHGTVYVPVLAGMSRAPDTLSWGWQGVYNTSTSLWANRRVLNYAQVKFSYMIEQIHAVQSQCESASVQLISDHDRKFAHRAGGELSGEELVTLQDVFEANARKAALEMNRLFNFLLFSYPDGYLDHWDDAGFHSTSLGYPVWWLEAGNYVDGPPDVEATAMQLQLAKQRQQHELSARPSQQSGQWGAERVPGVALAGVRDSDPAAPSTQQSERVVDCFRRCATSTEDSAYRACTLSCMMT